MSILDFLFPKRCVICYRLGNYLCDICLTYLSFEVKNICLVCNKPSFNNLTHPVCKSKYAIEGCFSAIVYNKTAKKLIYKFKYKPYLSDLNKDLSNLFYESIIQNENFNKLMVDGEWLMVPIPLSNSRFKKRGYNQSEILAKELSKRFGFKTLNILSRIRDTKTQVGLSDVDRKLNIKNAFKIVDGKWSIVDKNIILVDDVVTTGSTLKEAAGVLKKAGVKKVIGLTLARD